MTRVRTYPRGVTFHAGNLKKPWQARIWFRGRRYSLGYFTSCMGAEVAYNNMKILINEESPDFMRNLLTEETDKLQPQPEQRQPIEQPE